MPSVSNLDQDVKNSRMSRYTTSTTNETREWIESSLGRSLQSGDLLESLKDGVALCELANLVLPPPGIKYKTSNMPFVQMENISHFLRACEVPPLSMPAHDRFLTVDLYEAKDPAQVLQCLSAFSRKANAVKPDRFPSTIGPKKAGVTSPPSIAKSSVGVTKLQPTSPTPARALSSETTGGSLGSPSGSQNAAPVSSWSKKTDEGVTAPAWAIHQYGYLGGASQGNQGISFGARRQITSQSPQVPSLADKERRRKEKAEEDERLQREQAQAEEQARLQREREEEAEKLAEEQRWEEETRRQREQERIQLEKQKREWEEQEKQWKAEEERRRQEQERELPVRQPETVRTSSNTILQGQTLSQYQKGLSKQGDTSSHATVSAEQARVKELEKQLAEAKERERQYQAERDARARLEAEASTASQSEVEKSALASTAPVQRNADVADSVEPTQVPELPARQQPTSTPGYDHTTSQPAAEYEAIAQNTQEAERALPARPAAPTPITASTHDVEQNLRPASTLRSPFARPSNRTDTYLASNPAPAVTNPRISSSAEAGDTSLEQLSLQDQRTASQQKTRAGAWASKSILEREMERERERQKEWQANQDSLKNATRDTTEGTKEGQSWDVNQYGYLHGDSQNRGSSSGSGINFGGRRQIIGPRPQP